MREAGHATHAPTERVMSGNVFRAVELLPLMAFLAYAREIDTRAAGMHWQGPFLVGGGLAVIALATLVWKKVVVNRITLGINLHLMTGAAAFLLQLWWLLRLYGSLKAAGMLAWVVIVGVVTLIGSPHGFIGVPHGERKAICLHSCALFLVAVGAFVTAWVFQEHARLSTVIPFAALYGAHALLRARVSARAGERLRPRADAPPGPTP